MPGYSTQTQPLLTQVKGVGEHRLVGDGGAAGGGRTRTGASAARLYWEGFRGLGMPDQHRPVTVPAAVTVFPRDLQKLPRSWVEERYRDLRYWSVAERGGHFPMLEVPNAFCSEIRAAFTNAPA